MLQSKEIQRRFSCVEQAIGLAAQACSAERNLPGELRDCIQRLDRQSDLAKEVLQTRDEARIRQIFADLAQLSERALRVCSSGAHLTPQMRSAVNHLHAELAEMKLQLH